MVAPLRNSCVNNPFTIAGIENGLDKIQDDHDQRNAEYTENGKAHHGGCVWNGVDRIEQRRNTLDIESMLNDDGTGK